MPPTPSCSLGVPDTVTLSEKLTVIGIVGDPTLYVPLAIVVVTLRTVGAVVSTTRFLLKSRDPVAPGVASVSTASFPALSLILRPPLLRALVDV